MTAEYGAQLKEGLAVMSTRGKPLNRVASSTCGVPRPLAAMDYLKKYLLSEDTPKAKRSK